jgi:hypothetical protein
MTLLEEQMSYVDRIDEVGDRTSEGQAAGVYEAGFYSRVSGKGRSLGWNKGTSRLVLTRS